MSLVKSKLSGKDPVLQTRLDYYNLEVAKAAEFEKAQSDIPPRMRKTYPLPEILKPGDVSHIDERGNKVLLRDNQMNHEDCRLVDPENSSYATPWFPAGSDKDLELEWTYLNA